MASEEEIEKLINNLQHDGKTRKNAYEALVKIGKPAVEPLIRGLDNPDDTVKLKIIETLAEIGDPRATKPLIMLMEGKWIENEIIFNAAAALGKIKDPRAIIPLVNLFCKVHGEIRENAAWALAEIGEPAIEPVIERLKYRIWITRDGAANTLAKIAEKGIEIDLEKIHKAQEEFIENEPEARKKLARKDVGKELYIIKAGIRRGRGAMEGVLSDGKPKPPLGRNRVSRIQRAFSN